MPALYFHWPFCLLKCPYCDFFTTYPSPSLSEAYYAALLQELASYYKQVPDKITSIYFGGGTPSLLTFNQLREILENVQANFTLTKEIEITLEANPEDLTLDRLHFFYKAGINRLSLGIQSFLPQELKLLGRGHQAEKIKYLIAEAREAGFKNISLDLIFALPEQTLTSWQENLQKALETNVEHLSLYCLTWEKKTVFARLKEQEKLKPCTEEKEYQMYRLAQKFLNSAGYLQYEVSNFAREGCYSRHNTIYWKNQSYLGIGAGAASYDGVTRKQNVFSLRQYIKLINNNTPPIEYEESLTGKEKMRETIFLALRTCAGLDKNAFLQQFGESVEENFSPIIKKLVQNEFLVDTPASLAIPPEKMVLLDAISREFF